MKMTEIRIHRLLPPRGRLLAIAAVTFDNAIVIREIKIRKERSSDALCIEFPTNVAPATGNRYSVAFPTCESVKETILVTVTTAYKNHLKCCRGKDDSTWNISQEINMNPSER
jgi:DNA-binding cell septation regulator SpoVG